jgi:O-antigen/teichoic acid export membrane protein
VWGAGTFNFIACLLLIPRLKITGAALAFIFTYALMLFWLWWAKDSYLE